MRPGTFHAFTRDGPKSEPNRSDFISVADPTQVTFVFIGQRQYVLM